MAKLLIVLSLLFASTMASYGQTTLIPQPSEAEFYEGKFVLNRECEIFTNEKNHFTLDYLRGLLTKAAALPLNVAAVTPSANYIQLLLKTDADIPEEGYLLEISEKGVVVTATTSSGIFYGVQTLLQLLPPSVYSGNVTGHEDWSLQYVKISDRPRFRYRGLMLDVSRTFFDVKTVKEHINWLAHHKMNKFHWHLTDDNGWRIEIKRYPLLTQMGAWRGDEEVLSPVYGSGPKRYGGFYTQAEIRDVVAYAAERFIEIIPEIELPGHSRAVIVTYPETGCSGRDTSVSVQGEEKNVWCVGNENNFQMIENIIKELTKLFPSKYIHIGGDEVNFNSWLNCPHCKALMKKEGMEKPEELQNYFVRKVESILERNGRHMAGWDEIMDGGKLNKNSRVYAWRSVGKGIESAKRGHSTVMQPSSFCYLDMKQSPVERGHNWAGIVTLEKSYSLDPLGSDELSDSEASNIEGVQGGLWSELLVRPPKFIDYQIYPRIVALAEVGWTQPEKKNWDEFNKNLGSVHYERLFHMGVNFRVPPPEVVYEEGSIRVKPPFPWSVVRYTGDEKDPDRLSPLYKGEIFTDQPLKYRFATFYNDLLRSPVVRVSNISPAYQKIPFIIETSLSFDPRFPVTNIMDNNLSTYSRTSQKLRKGDYITFVFDRAVATKRIFVCTGIPLIEFYYVTDGFAEFSYDGINYIRGDDLVYGNAVIIPEKPVKSVRIMVNSPNDARTAAFQDLKIE